MNSFTISASNDPSFRTFNVIYNGESSGQTIAPERYDVTDLARKYVRITVTGNSENNNWASITGVNINAELVLRPPIAKHLQLQEQEFQQVEVTQIYLKILLITK